MPLAIYLRASDRHAQNPCREGIQAHPEPGRACHVLFVAAFGRICARSSSAYSITVQRMFHHLQLRQRHCGTIATDLRGTVERQTANSKAANPRCGPHPKSLMAAFGSPPPYSVRNTAL